MTERITPRQFHAAAGVEDWRVLVSTACAHFRTRSFADGVALVDAIGLLAEDENHHPDIDLRYRGVTVHLRTHEVDGLSERDITLARQISAAARELGIAADPATVQSVGVTIEALDAPAVMPFWQALLGYRQEGEQGLVDPRRRGPGIWFQQADAPRPQRNRVCLDVAVPPDQAEARIAAAIAAGGRLVTDSFAPAWWVLADAEGNEARVVTWEERE